MTKYKLHKLNEMINDFLEDRKPEYVGMDGIVFTNLLQKELERLINED